MIFNSVFLKFFFFSFLGYVDKIGTAYTTETLASGFGAYLARVSVLFLFFFFFTS